MKGLFSTLLFVVIASTLHAQSLRGGFRVGPTAFVDLIRGDNGAPFEFQQGAITPELFARYQGKGHWAFEASLATPTRLTYEERVSAVGASWSNGVQETKAHYYNLGLVAQYEFTCHHARKDSTKRRLHYYIGMSATAALVNNRGEVYADGNPEASVMSIVTSDFQLWAGLNHTLTYDLSKQWTLIATGDFQLNLNELTGIGYAPLGIDYLDAAIGFRMGAAYRIWRKK